MGVDIKYDSFEKLWSRVSVNTRFLQTQKGRIKLKITHAI